MTERDANQLAADAKAARAKIVAALNLTPLVPPQSDDETDHIVNEAWSGLHDLMIAVALVGTLRQERDDLVEPLARKAAEQVIRAEAAEVALAGVRGQWQRDVSAWAVERGRLTRALTSTRQALAMLWQHYLLPISDEQREQVRRALADPGGDTAPADQVRQALSTALDIIVERWHQWEDDKRTLAEFMELTDEQYAMFAEKGPEGYIAAVSGAS